MVSNEASHNVDSLQPKRFVVLMLENRSFDHMLGYLRHPDPGLLGLTGAESNPLRPGASKRVFVSKDGVPNIYPGPGHQHEEVMRQLLLRDPPHAPRYNPGNEGFVWDYGKRIEEVGKRRWLSRLRALFGKKIGRPGDVMRCLHEAKLPVLGTLAREFAICDKWFCSVPGQTWPNRLFLHAATSDGTVDNKVRFYTNETIFEQLSAAGLTWAIYHDGPAQSWAFRRLWGRGHFRRMKAFYEDVESGDLPDYTFIEPRHFKLLKRYSNSQHPGNNARSSRDFDGGEKLICDIYSALIRNPEVWESTLFVITYDEHGGLYDHLPPPESRVRFADGKVSPEGFAFDLLGPRVPTVLVSPLIDRHTVDHTEYDHTSILATLRRHWSIPGGPLTNRDAKAATFERNISRSSPRTGEEIPRLDCEERSSLLRTLKDWIWRTWIGTWWSRRLGGEPEFDDFQRSLIRLTCLVERQITAERDEDRATLRAIDDLPEMDDAETAAFLDEAVLYDYPEKDLYSYFEDVTEMIDGYSE